MRVLGVDPGISGGLSVIEITDGAAPVLVGCIDIPVIGVGAKERVDVAAIRNFVEEHKPNRALIERAQAMPKQGASSGFKYGRAVGAIEATIALCSLPAEIIEPSIWKRHWHLPGKDKESGRQKALQLFPDAHAAFARKRDHGRAEAALIALYYVERQSRIAG
jgi:crossover junction endodeoxyribonuclease RuvC